MLDMPTYSALGGDLDDVAGAEGGVGVRDEVAVVASEMLRRPLSVIGNGRGSRRARSLE